VRAVYRSRRRCSPVRLDAWQPAQSVPEQASTSGDARLRELPDELRQRARYLGAAGGVDRRAQLDLVLGLEALGRDGRRRRWLGRAAAAPARSRLRVFGGGPALRRGRLGAFGGRLAFGRRGEFGRRGAFGGGRAPAWLGLRLCGWRGACDRGGGRLVGGSPLGGGAPRAGTLGASARQVRENPALVGVLGPLVVVCGSHARASSRIRETGRKALA
jgi:hypothetical protein